MAFHELAGSRCTRGCGTGAAGAVGGAPASASASATAAADAPSGSAAVGLCRTSREASTRTLLPASSSYDRGKKKASLLKHAWRRRRVHRQEEIFVCTARRHTTEQAAAFGGRGGRVPFQGAPPRRAAPRRGRCRHTATPPAGRPRRPAPLCALRCAAHRSPARRRLRSER